MVHAWQTLIRCPALRGVYAGLTQSNVGLIGAYVALWLAKMSSPARSLTISNIQFEAERREFKQDKA